MSFTGIHGSTITGSSEVGGGKKRRKIGRRRRMKRRKRKRRAIRDVGRLIRTPAPFAQIRDGSTSQLTVN